MPRDKSNKSAKVRKEKDPPSNDDLLPEKDTEASSPSPSAQTAQPPVTENVQPEPIAPSIVHSAIEEIAKDTPKVHDETESTANDAQPVQTTDASKSAPPLISPQKRTIPQSFPRIKQEGDEEDPLLGCTLAERYEILSLVGKGGMGSVYKARDIQEEKVVAIKIILPHLVEQSKVLKRFQREAQSVSALKHQNIAQVYASEISADGIPYIVMEYIEGPTLSDIIERERRLPYRRSVPIFCQIANALQHAHTQGVIHRDLKPSNILVRNKDGQDLIAIVDFGMAKMLPRADMQHSTLTHTGDVFGSPPYMSPEQCQGQKADHRADIYSFGCLMYETLTGRPPLMADSPVQTVIRQIQTIPPPMLENCPEAHVPPKLENEIIFKALAKDPASRQQSMTALENELRSFMKWDEEGFESAPVDTWTKAKQFYLRNQKLCRWTGGILLIIGCVLFYNWYQWVTDWDRSLRLLFSGIVVAILGVATFKFLRLHQKMCTVSTSTPVWQLAWQAGTLNNTDSEQLKTELKTIISSIEEGSSLEYRNSQEHLRATLEKLELAGCVEDVQYNSTHAIEVLRKQGKEEREVTLMFKEFLADSLYASKIYDRAETMYRAILESWNEFDSFSSQVRCHVQLKLADAVFSQQQAQAAETLYSTYLLRWDVLSLPHDRTYALRVSRLGDCYCGMEKFRLARETYQKSMELWQEQKDQANCSLAFIKYAYACFKSFKPVDINRFKKELKTIEQAFGNNSVHTATTLSLCSTYLWKDFQLFEATSYRQLSEAIISPQATRPVLPKVDPS